ncbi:Carboxypeptidase Y like protein [Verticillium longisporum]|uniref:Carboxypeptidase n=1 Tax=Verticillium longisporum TaxID=100787 RepID=A0A0G4NFM0_VERLO|nr:Carboxypeptidase Y like protein [Verticillium longisporum]KAG7143363.1 Carboxypeptidase Y like protein [Verticillium longisporum]KAG7148933.1 Carboxypeptidase Y like protein [Verticillium longisporum]CRJ80747.1 hypothetical protein BN1708_000362 [Verticillium longisporum]CRK45326.1 hypothetical protein BN1723_006553 [Verticillium longisporum]
MLAHTRCRGPGASSVAFGGLMELGPCRIAAEGGYTVNNPFSWNERANLLFVDQPAGVGFSRSNEIIDGLSRSSQLMNRFLRQFFIGFPEFVGRDFYIAGESYGGSWVPALAADILHAQDEPAKDFSSSTNFPDQMPLINPSTPSRATTINPKGIMIGNGLVRQSAQNPAGIEAACDGAAGLFSSERCHEFAPLSLWCEQTLPVCETKGWLAKACLHAQKECEGLTNVVLGELHRNPYDWRRECKEDPELCYREISLIGDFLNSSSVKQALNVPENLAFEAMSYDVFEQWQSVGDLWKTSHGYVEDLLSRSVRVLLYVGDKDWFCHAAGMRRLVNEGFSWRGKPLFRFRELRPWYSGLKKARTFKALEPLSYAEVNEAGHMVPFDQPEAALALVNSWIDGKLGA